MGLQDARDKERDANCESGWHYYDPIGFDCIWCDHEEPNFEAGHAALLAMPEPPPGSVVLAEGPRGQAYQRHYSDGLWHACGTRPGGRVTPWSFLIAADRRPSRLRLLYVPPSLEAPSMLGRRRRPVEFGAAQLEQLRRNDSQAADRIGGVIHK